MISRAELKYVDSWANKIPMPGEEHSLKVLNEIKRCYEIFKSKYQDKEYNFIFSNGEEINLVILSKNLCHMLGIDYQNIKGDYFNVYRREVFNTDASDMTSLQLLELIIENMERVAEEDNNPRNKAKAINYYKSAIKCAVFNGLSDFEKFNFGALNNTEEGNQVVLYTPSNEAVTPYFAMGIQKDADFNNYFVKTLLAVEDPVVFFSNKEAMIPTQIIVADSEKFVKMVATPEEKINLLNLYHSIVNEYELPNLMNIYGDYYAMLNELQRGNSLVRKK